MADAQRLTVDTFSTIGRLHQTGGAISEDYAYAAIAGEQWAIGAVGDGCSGAIANTDLGARVMCHAFLRTVQEEATPGEIGAGEAFAGKLHENVINAAFTTDAQDYIATLVGFSATEERASLYVFGDGATAIKYRDGRIRLTTYTWVDGMPYYFIYRIEPQAIGRFHARFGDGAQFAVRAVTTDFVTDNGAIRVLWSETTELRFADMQHGRVVHCSPIRDRIEAIAVLTDGIDKFGDQANTEVVAKLLAFAGSAPQALRRNAVAVLAEELSRGAFPRDDLSVACVAFADPRS
ncbi:MAG: protein phosphatase 2C domain-containing protein [Casimicrobiaceae bacterium]